MGNTCCLAIGCASSDEQDSGGSGNVTDAELKELFNHVGNGTSVLESHVVDWFTRVEQPKDNPERDAVKQRAKTAFNNMSGSANATKVGLGEWRVWCSEQRESLGDGEFRKWFNKFNK